jgi:hypothetical protein
MTQYVLKQGDQYVKNVLWLGKHISFDFTDDLQEAKVFNASTFAMDNVKKHWSNFKIFEVKNVIQLVKELEEDSE